MSRKLFTPVHLGDLQIKNRVVMAPLTRTRAADDGTPTPMMATHYGQRASAGLIITEMTTVSAQGKGYLNMPGIYEPEHVAGWREVTKAVHERGGLIVAQIGHGGRISHPDIQPNGELPVAPSAIRPEGTARTRSGAQPFVTPRAPGTEEIPDIVAQFRHAAVLAKEAGLDGVELHAANGYLLDQFLRDGTNHRTDRYGGTPKNRARLLVEVATAVSEVLGPGRVGVRFSPFSPFNDITDSNPQATFIVAAAALAPLSLAYLHVIEFVSPTTPATFTAELRKAFGGPVIANGGHTVETANSALELGHADAVSFGTQFLANPDLPERFEAGAALNVPDPTTFYSGGERGYTDYPRLGAQASASAAV